MKDFIPHINTTKGAITGVARVGKFFRGNLTGNKFSVRRISKTGGNEIKPYVSDTINNEGSGTLIDIEIKLSGSVYLKMGIGYLTILTAIILGLIEGEHAWYKYLLPGFILIFGYAFRLLHFNKEAQSAEDKLMEIFSENDWSPMNH